ncbi:type IV toxin-antitoxin system AbiEi family antitoxin domain-containing protein [Algoriphagus yeomjeoni]|uniref:type IV toxin-antitoxin system AbiEi family antitoxin domain-containing protein n=1 Tax=Algoriphagus yeomjeoni TaxID=291403 RepID=UPI003CE48D37
MEVSELLEGYHEEPLTRQVMLSLLRSYKRPNDKISELVKSDWLTIVKNGIYIPGPKSKLTRPEPFLLANHIWGPSYVSMESALSYWGMIPERVFEITSVTVKSTKAYKTAVGRFSYKQAPLPYYTFGIRSVNLTPRQTAMIASPEKAICDKIIMTPGINLRSNKQVMDFLIEDMRIDEDLLLKFDLEALSSWIPDAAKKPSLEMAVKTIQSL